MKSVLRTIVVVLAAALSACSKEEAPHVAPSGGAATETPAAPPATEPANAASAPAPAPAPDPAPAPIDASSPVGAWTLDANASLDMNVAALVAKAESITPEQEKGLRSAVAMVVALLQMDVVLAADGSLSGTTTAPSIGGAAAASAALTGTWALESDVLRMTTRQVGAVETETLTGRFEGEQLVLLLEQNGAPPMSLIFVRKG
jgi:2-oxoglutarate dehydrogenase E2 component (dihydrolipoamide succinyltransferase)